MKIGLLLATSISLWTGMWPLLVAKTASHIWPLLCSSYSCVDSRPKKPGTSYSLFSSCLTELKNR